MIELDALDRKLIQILEKNADQSSTKIAKLLNVSSLTVRRRIKRLLKAKVFRIQAITDPAYMGVAITAGFNLQVDNNKVSQVISNLIKRPEIIFMARTTGKWDLVFWAWFDSSEHLSSFVDTVLDHLEAVSRTELTIFTSIQKYMRAPMYK